MNKREEVQEAAVRDIRDCDYTGAYVISPRVGKSKIVVDAIGDYWRGWDIVIATPRQTINVSWFHELGTWGPSQMSGAESLDIICFASLKKIEEGLDLLVIDEWHMLSLNQMQTIKEKKPKRILLVTGTANNYSRGLLKYVLGMEVRFEYSIEQAILDGIIANFHVYIVKVPLDNVDVKGHVHGGAATERQLYDYYTLMFDELRIVSKVKPQLINAKDAMARRRAHLIYHSENKLNVVKRIIKALEHHRKLIFTTRTAIADKLCAYSYHSKNKKDNNLKKFLNGEINELAVVQMTDMGITFPKLKWEVVHQLQSNSEDSLQKFLRTCNLEDEKEAKIIVTVCENTMDEAWVNEAMTGVPKEKITWVELNELENLLNEFR